MLKVRQVGAPRIVPSRRVVLQGPHVMADGLVVADQLHVGSRRGPVVKLDKRTLSEIWCRKANLDLIGGLGDLILFRYAHERQVWDGSGEVLWKRHYPGGLLPWDGRLLHFMGSEMQTVDPGTGEVVERLPLEGDWTEVAKHVVLDDVVLVGPRTSYDQLRAFDLRHRQVRWERNVASDLRERFGTESPYGLSLVSSGPGRFIGSSGEHVYGFSVADGNPRWMQPLGLDYRTAPVRDGRIYAWSTTGSSTTRTTIDMDLGVMTREVTAPATSRNHFVAIDEATGDIVMDRDLAAEGAPFDQFQEPGRATFCRRHMVYATRSGWIVLFRLSDGEVIWRQQYKNRVYAPAFDDNRLYFPCVDGTLVVFEAEGEEL